MLIGLMPTFYESFCLETSPRGRERRRKLRWRMTQDEAIAWAAANPGKRLEMVPNSAEERKGGGYVGWGQVLKLRDGK
jgi:hypothetical protein